MEPLFFGDWYGVLRTFIITILAYITIVFFLRVSGKRTLAQMKAFDFIITVALGSSLATVALNKQVPLIEGALVFLLLILLQFLLTWVSVRIPQVRTIVTATPSLLLYKGEMLPQMMKRERVAQEDLFEKIRESGYSGYSDIDAIILETTGDITIISSIDEENRHALDNVRHMPADNS